MDVKSPSPNQTSSVCTKPTIHCGCRAAHSCATASASCLSPYQPSKAAASSSGNVPLPGAYLMMPHVFWFEGSSAVISVLSLMFDCPNFIPLCPDSIGGECRSARQEPTVSTLLGLSFPQSMVSRRISLQAKEAT